MKLSLRLVLLLAAGITLVTLVVTWTEVRSDQAARQLDWEDRAKQVAERLQEAIEPTLRQTSPTQTRNGIEEFVGRDGVVAAAMSDARGRPIAATSSFTTDVDLASSALIRCAVAKDEGCGQFTTLGDQPVYLYSLPLRRNRSLDAVLTMVRDASDVSARRRRVWRTALLRAVPQILLMLFVIVAVVQSTVLRPIAKTARWMNELRAGLTTTKPTTGGILAPISFEVEGLATSLASARASAEEEARLREAADSLWTPDRLRVGLQKRLHGSHLVVISNREPYQHVRHGGRIEVLVPASGLVTALEPVLQACEGTWIAHGSADGDREVVDANDRVRVPPGRERYSLRRIWLTKEEESGYYFGFANEGLWPLCHIAHTRPIFRASDWEQYQAVNQKFADVAMEEIGRIEAPFVLIQDYHFALLPRLIKARHPKARVAVFWHIPWPNPEAFGICPWQRELLDGLLGADIVSFHIQAHCLHFLQTVDRAVECRIEWERFTVNRGNHSTLVRPHPISVAFPEPLDDAGELAVVEDAIEARRRVGATGIILGVGVDRIDYTKGILERFRAIERFLEKHSAYREQFNFVQVGAPSRTEIRRYHDLVAEVRAEADRINSKFGTSSWKPILLFSKHHDHKEITPLYRAADFCMVTSLHDGMNLVAKEFVSHRRDEDGVLILSQFAGASSELRDALIVNPYDVEQLADAIQAAIEMPPIERRHRMQRMRRVVKEHNVYRWAADLVSDMIELQPESPSVRVVS